MKLKSLFILAIVSLPASAHAARFTQSRIAIGQGISSPTSTSPVNFSNGLTESNAAAAASFSRAHISLEGTTDNPTQLGGELGIGSGTAGLGLGYIKSTCDGCGGAFGAIGGLSLGGAALGVGFHENSVYSAGAIFNPRGMHRLGLAFDYWGGGSKVSNIGVGYSFHGQNVMFALDASRRQANGSAANGLFMVTPGLGVSSGMFSASISYDVYLNKNLSEFANQLWFGLGIGGDRINVALYHKYVNDWSLAATFWL